MISRRGIAPLLAALCWASAGRAAVQQDVLILRNGEHRAGTLQSCVSDNCYFDGKPTAIPLIAWIGLAPPSPHPPALQNLAADQDEVHHADGTVVLGHLVGISLGDVLLQEGDLERKNVAWIHLKGAPGENPQGEIVAPPAKEEDKGKEQTGTTGTGGGQSGKPAGTGAPDKASGERAARPGATKGALWQGKVRARMSSSTESGTTQVDVQAQVRLREYRSPLRDHGKIVGTFIDLEHEGTEVREDFHQVVPGAGSSSGSGSHTLTTLPGDSNAHPSAIYLKSSAGADTTRVVGFDVPFPGGRYFAGVTQGDDQYEVRGSYNGQAISELHRFLPVGFGRTPVGPHTNWVEDPQLRSLGADGVMAGSFNARDPEGGGRLRVTWAICREGVKCIEPPDPGTEQGCGNADQQQALWETCQEQVKALERQLKPQWDALQAARHAASQHLGDYKKAVVICTAWDASMAVLEAAVTWELSAEHVWGSGVSEETLEEIKTFVKAVEHVDEIMDKLTEGQKQNAAAELTPEETRDLIDALKVINKSLSFLHGILGAENPEAMAESLQDCGAPISDDLYASAREYVRQLGEMLDRMTEVSKLLNDVGSKGNECLQRQWDAYAACVQQARCEGTPESACTDKKPPGNWPEVP